MILLKLVGRRDGGCQVRHCRLILLPKVTCILVGGCHVLRNMLCMGSLMVSFPMIGSHEEGLGYIVLDLICGLVPLLPWVLQYGVSM